MENIQPGKCGTCYRSSKFDECSRAQCPRRKQVTARQNGSQVFMGNSEGSKFIIPTTPTESDYD